MARKNTHLHAMKVSGDVEISLAADFTTEYTHVQFLDNIGIQAVWAGAAPAGEIFVEASNDYKPNIEPGTWSALDFGVPILITGNSGNHLININQIAFSWIRVRYVRSSGSGTLILTAVEKQIGG